MGKTQGMLPCLVRAGGTFGVQPVPPRNVSTTALPFPGIPSWARHCYK